MLHRIKNIFNYLVLFAGLVMLSSCMGADFTPDFFGLGSDNSAVRQDTGKKPPEEDPEEVTIYKLVVDKGGKQAEIPLPSGQILEVSSGTFIATDETNIGNKYSTAAKFKIVNTGKKPVKLSMPSQLGPFFISSLGKLEGKLAPKQSLIITVTFAPSTETQSEGKKVYKELVIGKQTFKLSGVAIEATGLAAFNVIGNTGNKILSGANLLTFDEIALAAHPRRQFFQCNTISCAGETMLTKCKPCISILEGTCQLLQVNKGGQAIDEVNEKCVALRADTRPVSEINLASTDIIKTKADRKIIEVVNSGTEPLIISGVKIKEVINSKSNKQFSINEDAIFIAESFDEVQKKILQDFDSGKNVETARFPIVLPPFDPPTLNTRLYFAVAYHPNDTLGSDGQPAAVGSSSKDEAILTMKTDEGNEYTLRLAGATTIKEIPALQIYAKTSVGLRPITDGDTLPFRGITQDTSNLAIPIFMKLSESSTIGLRISSISLKGDNFEWLDTAEKIAAKDSEFRCTVPIYDDKGSQIDILTDLKPVSLNPKGFTIEPGIHNIKNMPLFGCVNFIRESKSESAKRVFEAEMIIKAQELSTSGKLATNPDGSAKETTFTFNLLGVIDPLRGRLVFRLTQSMALILNPQFPGLSAIPSEEEMNIMISEGKAKEADKEVFLLPVILDPFDEETIYNMDGSIATEPGDGKTAIFRPLDTRAVPINYEDPELFDYTSLIYDSTLPEGEQGTFFDYPNIPENYKSSGLTVFTGTLSYPGPMAPPEERPSSPSECEVVDPCTAEGQRKLGEGNNNPNYKGVCSFFYVTAGRKDSPALHYPTDETPGNRRDFCKNRETPYELNSVSGKYDLNGKLEFENIGMLFQAATYFHNPSGPLGPVKPMDEMFNVTFTTETILPILETKTIDRVPDKRIDVAKGEYKINLNDPYSDLTPICSNNSKNRYLKGEYYSTWRYLSKLLKKDKEGTIAAGCPETDNDFTGGIAYLSGKRLNHENGSVTFVTVSKFSSSDNLTFAFKNVMYFMVLNGWLCDPLGSEDDMEGSHCFDKKFNYKDGVTQFSIIGGK